MWNLLTLFQSLSLLTRGLYLTNFFFIILYYYLGRPKRRVQSNQKFFFKYKFRNNQFRFGNIQYLDLKHFFISRKFLTFYLFYLIYYKATNWPLKTIDLVYFQQLHAITFPHRWFIWQMLPYALICPLSIVQSLLRYNKLHLDNFMCVIHYLSGQITYHMVLPLNEFKPRDPLVRSVKKFVRGGRKSKMLPNLLCLRPANLDLKIFGGIPNSYNRYCEDRRH